MEARKYSSNKTVQYKNSMHEKDPKFIPHATTWLNQRRWETVGEKTKINLNQLIDEIKIIVKENDIKGIIIGNPINMDGSEGPSSQSIKDTCRIISENLDLPISLWDERLSTVGAFNLSSQLDVNISKRVKNIDQNAATFILQGAIDYLNN